MLIRINQSTKEFQMDKYLSGKQEYADHQLYWNLKKIAGACDLKLKGVAGEGEHGEDHYVLFRIGETENEPVAQCGDLRGVVFALCHHIRYKATADVNRGIYLHKEKGIEKYR